MNKEIVERIKKLLNLASSPNAHEAELAAKKAQELLMRFNMSLQDLGDPSARDYQTQILRTESRSFPEQVWIGDILNEFFFAKLISSRDYDPRDGVMLTKFYILGEATNVAVATQVYWFLYHKFRQLWEAHVTERRGTDSPARRRKAFYAGLHEGLGSQLRANKAKLVTEKGLVIVPDGRLELFINRQFPNLRNKTARVKRWDDEAFADGLDKGSKIKIQQGLTAGAERNGLLIGSES